MVSLFPQNSDQHQNGSSYGQNPDQPPVLPGLGQCRFVGCIWLIRGVRRVGHVRLIGSNRILRGIRFVRLVRFLWGRLGILRDIVVGDGPDGPTVGDLGGEPVRHIGLLHLPVVAIIQACPCMRPIIVLV